MEWIQHNSHSFATAERRCHMEEARTITPIGLHRPGSGPHAHPRQPATASKQLSCLHGPIVLHLPCIFAYLFFFSPCNEGRSVSGNISWNRINDLAGNLQLFLLWSMLQFYGGSGFYLAQLSSLLSNPVLWNKPQVFRKCIVWVVGIIYAQESFKGNG